MKRNPVSNVDNFLNGSKFQEQVQDTSVESFPIKQNKKFPIELSPELHQAIMNACTKQGYKTIKDFLYAAIIAKINEM